MKLKDRIESHLSNNYRPSFNFYSIDIDSEIVLATLEQTQPNYSFLIPVM